MGNGRVSSRAGYWVLLIATLAIGYGSARVWTSIRTSASIGTSTPQNAARRFVKAVNRKDWASVCSSFSRSYLRIGQRACIRLWYWGWKFYGDYRYMIVKEKWLGDRLRVYVKRPTHMDWFDLGKENGAWKVVKENPNG